MLTSILSPQSNNPSRNVGMLLVIVFNSFLTPISILQRDKNTFVARTKSEFASRPVPHKSTNTIWSTGRLANSEFILVANLLLSHVLLRKNYPFWDGNSGFPNLARTGHNLTHYCFSPYATNCFLSNSIQAVVLRTFVSI